MTALLPKTPRIEDPPYLDSYRDRECFARGLRNCSGDVVGHHVRLGWYASQYKPHDFWTVALCDGHHKRLHQIGEHRFWGELFNEDKHALIEVLRAHAEKQYEDWKRDH